MSLITIPLSQTEQQLACTAQSARLPKVLLIGPSLRIMGGQAVMADSLMRGMHADGVDIDFLPINPQPPGILRHTEKVKYLRTVVVSLFFVISLLKRMGRYDVIHLFSAAYSSFMVSQLPAILIARWYGKPLILNYRSGEAEDHLRRWGRCVFWALRLTDRIVVPSGFLVDVFGRFGFKATPIVNVIDDRAIRYRLRRFAEPRILVPRALEPLYNVGCAIRAFAVVQRRFPQAQLTVLGDGSQRKQLEQQVRDLNLRGVHFAGRVERSQIGNYYEGHDVLLNTTTIDNMPVSILEGFAAGLPIVTTDAGGIPYLMRDRENAHVVAVNDHEAAAERVIELLQRPAEVERLSRLGAVEVQKYLWDRVSRQWYQMYYETWRQHDNNPLHRS